jgi:serine/threonine protein kinase
LHRDIKPDNFLFGLEDKTNKLFLIDLGFCKRFEHDGKHIEAKENKHIIGTINFVSLNVHKGIEPSRRDDIESCVYILLYLYFGKLEWESIKDEKNIVKMKEQLITRESIPIFIRKFLEYTQKLSFDQKPNYTHLIDILKDAKT